MTFNLSARTRTIIDNFSRINPSMIFHEGSLIRTASPGEDLIGFCKVPETIPSKFAIYDLSKFLGILDLYDEPKIDVNEKTLTILGSGRKFTYTLASENLFKSPSDKSYKTLHSANEEGLIVQLELPVKELVSLKKNVTIADLPDVAIVSDGSLVNLKGFNKSNETSDEYSVQLICNKTPPKFNVIFSQQKINSLIDEDYKINVSKNIVLFKSKDVEYFVAPEDGSSYE